MKEEGKYYTPETIEELQVNQEVLLLDADNYKATSQCSKYPVNGRITDLCDYPYVWVDTGNEGIGRYEIYLYQIGIKYLDREDIESLGFEIITEHIHIYKKGNFRMYKTESYGNNHYSIQKFDDNQNIFDVFSGTIKNKSELKRILKQIGI